MGMMGLSQDSLSSSPLGDIRNEKKGLLSCLGLSTGKTNRAFSAALIVDLSKVLCLVKGRQREETFVSTSLWQFRVVQLCG